MILRNRLVTRRAAIFTGFSTEGVKVKIELNIGFPNLAKIKDKSRKFRLTRNLFSAFQHMRVGDAMYDSLLFHSLFVPLRDQFEGAREHGTRAGAVSLADETFALHLIEHGGGAAITDAQSTLQD